MLGTLLNSGVKGYLFSKQNNDSYQKVSLAMDRLYKELRNAEKIYQFTTDSIRFERDGQQYGLALVGTTLQILRDTIPNATTDPGNILLDNVTAVTLTLVNASQANWTVNGNDNVDDLFLITLEVNVNVNSTTQKFTISVSPFFNDSPNGATS